jgi:hypothetical protein
MSETAEQRQWREDARVLGEIGRLLARADLPAVTVRLPLPLARAAVEAWNRSYEGELGRESYEQRVARRRARTLGLIGLSVEERGGATGDEVVVDLSPNLIGSAVDAADDPPA